MTEPRRQGHWTIALLREWTRTVTFWVIIAFVAFAVTMAVVNGAPKEQRKPGVCNGPIPLDSPLLDNCADALDPN